MSPACQRVNFSNQEQEAPLALLWTKWQRHTKVANRKRSPGKGALEVEKGDEKKKKNMQTNPPEVLANQVPGGDMWNSIADYCSSSMKPRDLEGFGVHVGAG